jgi:hypothetical protein
LSRRFSGGCDFTAVVAGRPAARVDLDEASPFARVVASVREADSIADSSLAVAVNRAPREVDQDLVKEVIAPLPVLGGVEEGQQNGEGGTVRAGWHFVQSH